MPASPAFRPRIDFTEGPSLVLGMTLAPLGMTCSRRFYPTTPAARMLPVVMKAMSLAYAAATECASRLHVVQADRVDVAALLA